MKIADIQVTNLHFDYPGRAGFRYAGGVVTSRVTSLVTVVTEDGTIGLGAAYSHPDLIKLIVEKHLRPLLLGDDPREVESLWDKMYSLTRWYGRKGAAISALGGLDIAFWDLRGKSRGEPIYRMLGGTRASTPAYASGLFWHDNVDELEREAARHRQNGFRRVKTRLGQSEAYDTSAVDAVLRGIGPDGNVLVDGSHRFTLDTGEQIGKFLQDRSVFWFEEPFPPEDIDSYIAFRPRLSVPLAAGENDFGTEGFRELLRSGAVDIAQPDACRAGGITSCWRVGLLAAQTDVKIATHTWSDAVALIANAHVVAALPNGLTVEVDQTGNPFIEDLLIEPLQIRDGILVLSDAPGLGIELNPDVVAKYAMREDQTMPDGNFSDLVFGREYLSGGAGEYVTTKGHG